MNNNRIAIIGAGELGKQILHLGKKNGYCIVGFFDDYTSESTIDGIPVFGRLCDVNDNADLFDALVLAIGYNHFTERKQIFENLHSRFNFATIIDKSAIIDPLAVVEEGCVIYPNVVIDKDAYIGYNIVLNISCNISHNAHLEPHSYIAPAATILGYVSIGECVFVGAGSVIMEHLSIVSYVLIGALTFVNKSILETGIYVGLPFRKLR